MASALFNRQDTNDDNNTREAEPNANNERGLKGLYNKHIKTRVQNLKSYRINTSPRFAPRPVTALKAMFTWITLIVVSIPWLSAILVISFLRSDSWKSRVNLLNAWANFILTKLLKVKLKIEESGEDYGNPPYVFVMLNQTSLLESLLILPAALPSSTAVFTFANFEFLLIPLIGWVFWRALRAEMVVRQNPKQGRAALDRAVHRMIENKESIFISIEGRRSKDGTLSPYKKGPAVLAIKTGATIIPFIVMGANKIWPYGDWKIKLGGEVVVKFLPGIETKGMTMNDRFRITEQLRQLAEKNMQIDSAQTTI
eukprot:TRINITY_DN9801_c0_g1_i1.p1 TRINITY_DN9801_c0_g1~~TRINITY_DN9801_c0_g1_i1.p1  ORF type:complete len:359 (-),score=56.10 TRINITY_DN9801_c0_g1_i1:102-1037(-)